MPTALEVLREAAYFDEGKHPRGGKGSTTGGQFVSKSQGEHSGSRIADVRDRHTVRPPVRPPPPRPGSRTGNRPDPKTSTGDKPTTKPSKKTPLRKGASGDRVMALQQLLTLLGIETAADGQYGNLTEEAVRTAQRKLGMRETGRASKALLRRLADAAKLSPCIGGAKESTGQLDVDDYVDMLGDLDGEDDDEDETRESVSAWDVLRVAEAFYDVRVPGGNVGGGRFRKLSEMVFTALREWANGDGPDDPLKAFDRDQLRKVAAQAATALRASGDDARAARLTPKIRASHDEIKDLLYADTRRVAGTQRRGEDREVAKPAKAPAKKTAPKADAPKSDRSPLSPADRARHILADDSLTLRQKRARMKSLGLSPEQVDELAPLSSSGTKATPKAAKDVLDTVKKAAPAKAVPRKAAKAELPGGRRLTDAEADSLSTAKFSSDGAVVTSNARTVANLKRDGFIDEQGRITDAGRSALAAHKPSTFNATNASHELFNLRGDPEALREALAGRNLAQLRALYRVMMLPEPDSTATGDDMRQPFRLPDQRADAPALREDLAKKLLRRDRSATLTSPSTSIDIETGAPTKATFDARDVAAQVSGQQSEAGIITLLSGNPQLTSAKLRKVAEELGIDVPDNVKAKSSLQLHIAEKVAGNRGLPSVAAEREAEVEDAIRQAYARLAPSGGRNSYVQLRELRAELGERYPRAEVDAALVRLNRGNDATVTPETNLAGLSDADKAAAVLIGGQAKHAIAITGRRGTPSAEVSLSAARKVEIEDAVRTAYRRRAVDGWLSMAALREELGDDYPRAEVDQVLREMGRTPNAFIVPESNQKVLTPADRDAAVTIGNTPKHALRLTDSAPLRPKGEAAAGDAPGPTTKRQRAAKAVAVSQQRQANIATAQGLKAEGLSNVAIGEQMGINESSVRALLAPGAKDKAQVLASTSDMLRDQVAKRGLVDVGVGVERHIGISRTKLDAAIAALQQDGYEVHSVRIPQLGTGKLTEVKVLAAPGTTGSQVWRQRGEIAQITDVSGDGGRSFVPFQTPLSVSSNRVQVRYADQGGAEADGLILVRPGVADLSLGGSRYAQVRIAIDGNHFLKGMAVYSDDLPDGVDLVFHTSKTDTGNPLDAMKPMGSDPDNPFGATVRQRVDAAGNLTSALNVVGAKEGAGEEGGWNRWSRSLSSQFASKQSPELASTQLGVVRDRRQAEFAELLTLTNPTVKAKLLETFADSTDSASVHLKAAALPRQATRVILPVSSLKDNEVYAPTFRNGEKLVLVRYPHGGIFEIPELVVNNDNPEATKLLGDAPDAIAINHRVAQRLSGADFDGDTVLAIPNDEGQVTTAPALAELADFDPIALYRDPDLPPMTDDTKTTEMGKASNLITDMTLKNAPVDEIARAVRHSMVVIDAQKHSLDYRQSEVDHGIAELRLRYQGRKAGGAATLISKARAEIKNLPGRKPRSAAKGGPVDKATGAKVFEGAPGQRTSVRLAEVDDAHTLSSGTEIEGIYADHSNELKAMANKARLAATGTKPAGYSPDARKAHAGEVASLDAKLDRALRNAPLERSAQILAGAAVARKRAANPGMSRAEVKRLKARELTKARAATGAGKVRIVITDAEWAAIQAGAISPSKLGQILDNADLDVVKRLALPRARVGGVSDAGGMSAEEFDRLADSAVSGPDVSASIPVNPNSPGLGAAGQEALLSYMSTEFEGINDSLRGVKRADRRGKKMISALDDVMQSSPLGSDVVVWRGMGTGRGVFGDRLGADLTGFSWTEKAYVSTSYHRNVGEIFATRHRESPGILVRMVAPRGVHAVQTYGGEGEALLQRGLGMRVVRDHGNVLIPPPDAFGRPTGPPQPTRILDVEVIP